MSRQGELCLALDNLYGLKEIHDISSFDEVFTETGYKHDLLSTDPNVKDGALLDFINIIWMICIPGTYFHPILRMRPRRSAATA